MEHLGYLRKLYEYGETLSADELNEIVQYINTSIETINILIDREYAINNGHCEVRYKNSAQQPTKPATGSSGYSDGWSSNYTVPDTEHGEITWMSICFLNGNGEYGVWSSPVRITWGTTSGGGSGSGEGSGQGRDGEPGAFKSRVFKRQNTKPERPVGGSYTVPIPPGWYDGIPQGLAIIWSSVCTFYGDGTSSGWSDPAQESDTANLDVEFSPRINKPNPPYGNTPFSNHEAEGWYDPNSPNFNTAGEMRWRAERKVSNGVYDGPWVISCIVGEGGEQGPPGKTGGHHETRYKNHQITAANPIPVKPATGTDGTQNGWSITQPSLSSQDLLNDIVTFMSQCFVNEDGEYGEWTTPMRITGANGKDGEDGDEIEFIYTRSTIVWENPQAPFSPQIDDWTGSYDGRVWTDHPQGVNKDIPLEYVCQRNKIDGTWYPYSTPVVWSRWGRNGMDGDGCEYVFVRTDNDMPPTITNSDDTYDGKTYLDDDYCPLSSAGRCTDNPSGVTRNLRYEWAITRKMTEPTDLGVRQWTKYSGTMALWAKFTESTIRVDLDNENDSMLYSSSKGLVSGYVNSTASLFDGQKDVSGQATWAIQSSSGCTARLNNRTITVTEMSTISGYVVIQADYNGQTYTATLTLKKIIDGDKYDLIIKPSSISYNTTTDTPASTTITIEIWRTSVDGTRMKIAPPQGADGYSTYVLDGTRHLTSSNAASFTYNVDNSECGDITVKIAKGWDSEDYLDCETIPITKAKDGQGKFKSTMFVRMNNTPTKPSEFKGSFTSPSPPQCIAGRNSSGTEVSWSDGIPSGENILWATSRTFTSDGLAPQDSEWSDPKQMTDTSTYDVEFAKEQPSDAAPPVPTDANRHGGSGTQIWFDPDKDSSENFAAMYWRAEREKVNGVWGDWVIVRIKGEKGEYVEGFEIEYTPGVIRFKFDEGLRRETLVASSFRFTGLLTDWGQNSTEIINCYFGLYSRKGTTFTRIGYSTEYDYLWRNFAFNVTPDIDELILVSSPEILSGSQYANTLPTNSLCRKSIMIVLDGEQPQGTFVSHIFKRAATQPSTPTGGSYDDPLPPASQGWSDGVPSGTDIIWMSTRIFTTDGQSPQQSAWTTPQAMNDTADIEIEYSSAASPNPPQGYPQLNPNFYTNNPDWSNTADSTTIWMAIAECHNYNQWQAWKVIKIKGEKGDKGDRGNDGTNGRDGAQGSYEIKQYARSSYATTTNGTTMPADRSESDWSTTPPIPNTTRPYIWQRTRTYNPATNTYTDWVYVRLTGEIGAPGSAGQTGLWYNYAGVWGQDISSVTNTDRIGYYVQTSGGDFYMNTAPANTPNNNTPGGANWVRMQNEFKYIVTEAVFGDYAHLGSFIINGDWFISKEGKLGGSWSNQYTSFSPTGFPNSGFIPNIAMDAKTGKVYFNNANVEGYINATSGRIGNWTINNYGTGGISAESTSLPYIYLRQSNTNRMAVIGNYDSSDQTMIQGSYPGGKSIWAKGQGTSSSRGIGLYANAIMPSGNEQGSDAIYAQALGSDCTAISAYGQQGAKALEVSGGDTVIGGSGLFSVGCAVKTSNFTLPSSPKTGTIFLCKGSNLTVTTSSHKVTEGSDSSTLIAAGGSSHNFSSTTFMLFFDGSEWALLYSA